MNKAVQGTQQAHRTESIIGQMKEDKLAITIPSISETLFLQPWVEAVIKW